jgi:hypothetical protein
MQRKKLIRRLGLQPENLILWEHGNTKCWEHMSCSYEHIPSKPCRARLCTLAVGDMVGRAGKPPEGVVNRDRQLNCSSKRWNMERASKLTSAENLRRATDEWSAHGERGLGFYVTWPELLQGNAGQVARGVSVCPSLWTDQAGHLLHYTCICRPVVSDHIAAPGRLQHGELIQQTPRNGDW